MRAAQYSRRAYDETHTRPSHRSVTQLILPPRIDLLRKRHHNELTSDVADEFWALLGSAVHHILEWGAESHQEAEERIYTEIDGWIISGMLDVQNNLVDGMDENGKERKEIHIQDYKVTAAYNLLKENFNPETGKAEPKTEWVQQLNMQAYLVEKEKNIPVTSLEIVAIVRDWQRRLAQGDPFYPVAPVVRVPIPLWTTEKQEAYIRERIHSHRHAEMMTELSSGDDDLPECSPEERWENGTKWAVWKIGKIGGRGKRPTRVASSEAEAQAIVDNLTRDMGVAGGKKFTYEIEHRPGKPSRCVGNFCSVSEWCSQWKNDPRSKENNEQEKEQEKEQESEEDATRT